MQKISEDGSFPSNLNFLFQCLTILQNLLPKIPVVAFKRNQHKSSSEQILSEHYILPAAEKYYHQSALRTKYFDDSQSQISPGLDASLDGSLSLTPSPTIPYTDFPIEGSLVLEDIYQISTKILAILIQKCILHKNIIYSKEIHKTFQILCELITMIITIGNEVDAGWNKSDKPWLESLEKACITTNDYEVIEVGMECILKQTELEHYKIKTTWVKSILSQVKFLLPFFLPFQFYFILFFIFPLVILFKNIYYFSFICLF